MADEPSESPNCNEVNDDVIAENAPTIDVKKVPLLINDADDEICSDEEY